MEFLLLIFAIFMIGVLWVRTGELDRLLRLTQAEIERLRAALAELDQVGERAAARRRVPTEPAAAAVAPPAVHPLPAPPAPASGVVFPVESLWGTRGVPRPGTGTVAPSAAPARRRAGPSRPAAAAPERRPVWAAAMPVVPVGPSLTTRILLKLGLTPPAAGEGWSRATLEAWLEGRLLAVVGGIALVLAAIFFLSLAFSRGWITEPMRALIGLVVGAALLALGELSFTRLRGILGHVFVAVGLAIISLALLAATRLYGLVPAEWALLGAFVAAVAAAVIAIRHDSQLVAAFALVAVLAAPPAIGASATLVTLLFVAAALVGTTGVALFRTWIWLPPLAFLLAAPQLASYLVGGPPATEGLIAIAGFWLVNVLAAGGEETRHATDRLRTTTVTLLLTDAAFTLWAGFTVLSGTLEVWRGTFLTVMAVAHLALGIFFFVRKGDRHPFGLIVAATGVAALTMAAPVQFGGPPVPVAWAAEAVALAWVAVMRRHPYSAGLSILLAILALGHLLTVEYTPGAIAAGFTREIPFVGPEGVTFAFMIGALLVGGLAVPIAWVRTALAVVGGLVAIYVFPFELTGTALVAGWAGLATVGLVLYFRVVAPRITIGFRESRIPSLALPGPIVAPVAASVAFLSELVRPAFLTTGLLAGIGALAHLATLDYPLNLIVTGTAQAVPFFWLPGLSFAIVLAALAVVGVLVPIASIRIGLTALGGLVALYVFPFELSGPALMSAWAALATAAFVVHALVIEPRAPVAPAGSTFARLVRPAVAAVGTLIGAVALTHLVALDFPLGELGRQILPRVPYAVPESFSLAAILAALVVAGWVLRARWIRLGMTGIGLASLAYTVTFEVAQPHVTVAWGLLALASLAVVRRVAVVRPLPRGREVLHLAAERAPYAAAGLALSFMVVRALWLADPASFARHLLGTAFWDVTPFPDERTYVLVALATTFALCGWMWAGRMPLARAGIAAALVIAWLLMFEVRVGYAVAGWAALALAGLWVIRVVPQARTLLGEAAVALAGFGVLAAVGVVAPPDRLVVDATTSVVGWPFLSDATVALAALAIALGVGAYLHRSERLSLPAFGIVGVIVVYLLSVAVVDAFQRQVGVVVRPLEDLQKEAQVGLSVLWSVLGGAALAIGLLGHRAQVRVFGLALLGLATAKVFLVDLASLDVEYRVLSLVALGVLLLVSAVVFSRVQHPRGPVAPKHR
jgi:hypothetical protein